MNNIVKMQSNYSSTSSKYQMHQEFLPPWYYMPRYMSNPYYGNVSAINNVTEFNNYIFERFLDKCLNKINQSDKAKSNDSINQIYCESPHPNQSTSFYNELFNEKINNAIPWMKDTCFLYLIGNPEDVEELIKLPGIIIRDVYDETNNFTSEYFIKYKDSCSILRTKYQLIKYRLDSYYEVMPTWYNDYNNYGLMPTNSEGDIIELLDQPYSEYPEFKDPKRLKTINPVCVHHINPDERVYKIYIQMSADLIRTAYERSNFFIDIRNTKKKMSIKNFIEYLS